MKIDCIFEDKRNNIIAPGNQLWYFLPFATAKHLKLDIQTINKIRDKLLQCDSALQKVQRALAFFKHFFRALNCTKLSSRDFKTLKLKAPTATYII